MNCMSPKNSALDKRLLAKFLITSSNFLQTTFHSFPTNYEFYFNLPISNDSFKGIEVPRKDIAL